MSFEFVTQSLGSIRVAVWGEEAMAFHGAKILLNSFILIPSDEDFDLAVRNLETSGFRKTSWSYATANPQLLEGDKELQNLHAAVVPSYRMLDDNSVRFQFPESQSSHTTVVLLRSSYAAMRPPTDFSTMRRFTCQRNVYYPDQSLLMESFIKTLLKTPSGIWQTLLTAWAVSYTYSMCFVEESALDDCDNEKVKEWFNEHTRRGRGGIDRTTISKRVGRAYPLRKLC